MRHEVRLKVRLVSFGSVDKNVQCKCLARCRLDFLRFEALLQPKGDLASSIATAIADENWPDVWLHICLRFRQFPKQRLVANLAHKIHRENATALQQMSP